MTRLGIGRRALVSALLATPALPRTARARTRYVFDHAAGRLEFIRCSQRVPRCRAQQDTFDPIMQ